VAPEVGVSIRFVMQGSQIVSEVVEELPPKNAIKTIKNDSK
jgi:hypothetical protein